MLLRPQNGHIWNLVESHFGDTFIHVNINMFLPIQKSFDQSVDLATGGVRLLVQRRRDKVVLLSLTETEWRFLNDIAARNNLETIIENILGLEPDTDVVVLLQKFVVQSTLVDFTHQSNQS